MVKHLNPLTYIEAPDFNVFCHVMDINFAVLLLSLKLAVEEKYPISAPFGCSTP